MWITYSKQIDIKNSSLWSSLLIQVTQKGKVQHCIKQLWRIPCIHLSLLIYSEGHLLIHTTTDWFLTQAGTTSVCTVCSFSPFIIPPWTHRIMLTGWYVYYTITSILYMYLLSHTALRTCQRWQRFNFFFFNWPWQLSHVIFVVVKNYDNC